MSHKDLFTLFELVGDVAKAAIFLFVGLHCTLRNFKVRRSGKKIKIELNPKMYQLFVLPLKYFFCQRHTM